MSSPTLLHPAYFNSQPHEEADVGRLSGSWSDFISTHSLTKRLTRVTDPVSISASFQLTASRRGWPSANYVWGAYLYISTHSLTKRLTARMWFLSQTCCISTHSLTKRLTLSLREVVLRFFHFNSQPHEEADLLHGSYTMNARYFNSQPHEEADIILSAPTGATYVFQLTASRRGWRWEKSSRASIVYFNSQPHEEADVRSHGARRRDFCISTHSLTKRLTKNVFIIDNKITISTHSLTKRLTYVPPDVAIHQWISTHSLTKRLTTADCHRNA